MLIVADYVSPLRRTVLKKQSVILDATGTSYCVVPAGETCDGAFSLIAEYSQEFFCGQPYKAELRLPLQDGEVKLIASIDEAMDIIIFLAENLQWLAKLRMMRSDASDDQVIGDFGIDAAKSCRAAVKSWAEGYFLAPDQGGYSYFYVDIRGDLTILSWSRNLTVVALHMAATRENQRNGLSDRIGRMTLP